MNNEWFDIAWINHTKAILHGQIVRDGREVEIEQVLTDAQRERLYDLNHRHSRQLEALLRAFATEGPGHE